MKKEKLWRNKKMILAAAFFFSAIMLLSMVNAASTTYFTNPSTGSYSSTRSSITQFTNPPSNPWGGTYDKLISGAYVRGDLTAEGEEFYDMQVFIPPLGCQPYVVRSDLLEEQNVPVFCELDALKINPGVDISRISHVSFAQKTSDPNIVGVGFHPANAALRSTSSLINTPTDSKIGYVVVVLKKQPNENLMPEFVSANFSVVMEYGTQNPLGLGPGTYYLPVMDDADWQNNYMQYGFLNGLGYLRAENVESNGAQLSIYRDLNTVESSVSLEKGKTSRDIYLWTPNGGQGVNLVLKDITTPKTKAKLVVNGDKQELYAGDKIGSTGCTLKTLNAYGGGTGTAEIRCSGQTLSLEKKFNQVLLEVEGAEIQKSIGDSFTSSSGDKFSIIYLGNNAQTNRPFVVIAESIYSQEIDAATVKKMTKGFDRIMRTSPSDQSKFLDGISAEPDKIVSSQGTGWRDKFKNLMSALASKTSTYAAITKDLPYTSKMWYYTGFGTFARYHVVYLDEKSSTLSFVEFKGAQAYNLPTSSTTADTYYKKAKTFYDESYSKFSGLTNPVSPSTSPFNIYGADALWKEYNLAVALKQNEDALTLLSKIENEYKDSINPEGDTKGLTATEIIARGKNVLDVTGSTGYYEKGNYYFELEGVFEPEESDYSVSLSYIGPRETATSARPQSVPFVVSDTQTPFIDESVNNVKITLVSFTEDRAYFSYSCGTASTAADKTVSTGFKTGRVDAGIKNQINIPDCDVYITIDKINRKEVAQVQVLPISYGRSRESNFTFSIGIEKRSDLLKLTPEEANEKIKQLTETIAKWNETAKSLADLIKAGKVACLGTSAVMNVKNLFSGLSGEATARNAVMTQSGGWNDICADMVSKSKEYTDIEECINDNRAIIEDDVSAMQAAMNSYNTLETSFRAVSTEKRGLNERTLHNNVVNSLQNNGELLSTLDSSQREIITNPLFANNSGTTDTTELIKNLYMLKNGGLSSDMEEATRKSINSTLEKINAEMSVDKAATAINNAYPNLPISAPFTDRTTKAAYQGLTWTDTVKNTYLKGVNTALIDSDKSLAGAKFAVVPPRRDISGEYSYIVFLRDSGKDKLNINTAAIYKLSNTDKTITKVTKTSDIRDDLDTGMIFEVYDELAYQNYCKTGCSEVKVFSLDPYKGMISLLPFDRKNGWYLEMKNNLPFGTSTTSTISTYTDAGKVQSFYLCNVGKNGNLEGYGRGDDSCRRFDTTTGDTLDSFPGLSKEKTKSKVAEALNYLQKAQSDITSGKTEIVVNGEKLKVKSVGSSINGGRCTDFMSATDCQTIFNVCDPFICPSSRCDLGGEYPVDDVIASGILGSVFLCSPNWILFGGDVVVPVCITGIHAGIEGWVAIMESYRDCLNTSITENLTVGICDQMWSVYGCDFFWKEIGPFVTAFTKNIFTGNIFGKGGKGGGEYMFTNDAWTNAQKSWQYFQSSYAANSKMFFGAKSISEVGSEVCKLQASAAYPDAWDAALSPESPAQVHAWFDETSYTTATVPPRSQYGVFYFIYAGNDQGAEYTVYLKGSETALGGTTAGVSSGTTSGYGYGVVASGYVEKGGKVSEKVDFIDVSGYKQVCVRINEQDHCGFKSVSTSFALDYAKDKVLEDQATSKVTTENECISGSASVMGALITPNLQSAAEDAISPQLYNYGIIRVCSTDNPGKTTEPTRWSEVGYCDTTNVKCWVDTNSVKNAINGVGIENQTLSEINDLSTNQLLGQPGYMDTTAVNTNLSLVDEDYTNKVGKLSAKDIATGFDPVAFETLMNNLYEKAVFNTDKARILWKKAYVFDLAARAAIEGLSAAVADEKNVAEKTAAGVSGAGEISVETLTATAGNADRTSWGSYLKTFNVNDYGGVDMYALAMSESSIQQFNADGTSKCTTANLNTQACGIMQITSKALLEVNRMLDQAYDYSDVKSDATTNIKAGADYVKVLNENYVDSKIVNTRDFAIVAKYKMETASFDALQSKILSDITKYDAFADDGLPVWASEITSSDLIKGLTQYNTYRSAGTVSAPSTAGTTVTTASEQEKAVQALYALKNTQMRAYITYSGEGFLGTDTGVRSSQTITTLLDSLGFTSTERGEIFTNLNSVYNQIGTLYSSADIPATGMVIPLTTVQEGKLNELPFNCSDCGKGWFNACDKEECEEQTHFNIEKSTDKNGLRKYALVKDTECSYVGHFTDTAPCITQQEAQGIAATAAKAVLTNFQKYNSTFASVLDACSSLAETGRFCTCNRNLKEVEDLGNSLFTKETINFRILQNSLKMTDTSSNTLNYASKSSNVNIACYLDTAQTISQQNIGSQITKPAVLYLKDVYQQLNSGETTQTLSDLYVLIPESSSDLLLSDYLLIVDNNVCFVTQKTIAANSELKDIKNC